MPEGAPDDITGIHEGPSSEGAAEGTPPPIKGDSVPGSTDEGDEEDKEDKEDDDDDGKGVGSPGAGVGAGVGMSSMVHSSRGSARLYWEPR